MKYLWLILTMALFSCTTDSYDKGEGKYSLMQADFCELTVNGEKQGVNFQTDEGESYLLKTPITTKWIETADTTYRVILYFNKIDNATAEAMAAGAVVTLHPIEHWRFKDEMQDPIGYESGWLSKNGKYLNLGLLMKTGRIDDEELPHNIGLAQDTVYIYDNGRSAAYYRLLHSQNGIPEYYTNRRYVSILLPQQCPDTIHFSMQTYEGVTERIFITR